MSLSLLAASGRERATGIEVLEALGVPGQVPCIVGRMMVARLLLPAVTAAPAPVSDDTAVSHTEVIVVEEAEVPVATALTQRLPCIGFGRVLLLLIGAVLFTQTRKNLSSSAYCSSSISRHADSPHS